MPASYRLWTLQPSGARAATAGGSLPPLPGQASTALWRLVSIALCTRILASTARAPGVAARRTRAARHDTSAHRFRRRDALHVAARKRVWWDVPLQSVVSGPPHTVRLGMLQGSMTLGFDSSPTWVTNSVPTSRGSYSVRNDESSKIAPVFAGSPPVFPARASKRLRVFGA